MVDEVVIVQVADDLQVTTTVSMETIGNDTRVWVLSEIGELSVRNQVVLAANVNYSADQFAYDVEQARFQFARELAGVYRSQTVGVGLIQAVDPPPVLTEPLLSMPGGG